MDKLREDNSRGIDYSDHQLRQQAIKWMFNEITTKKLKMTNEEWESVQIEELFETNQTETIIHMVLKSTEDAAKINKNYVNLNKKDSDLIREHVDSKVFLRQKSWKCIAYNLRAQDKNVKT